MDRARQIRVDSVEEEHAFLAAYPPPGGGEWRVLSQRLGIREGGAIDVLRARADDGSEREFAFDIGSFYGSSDISPESIGKTGVLDGMMRRAEEFARENGAHHPGSLPRFPVPSDRYPGRLDVPLAVLAVDDGRRGLYAPPRVVTVERETGEPFGVGEFPGFDPDDWPPPKLGDWPPAGIAAVGRARLQGLIGRFGAIAGRVYEAWFTQAEYAQLGDERREYLDLLRLLDVEAMEPYYRALAGGFFRWIDEASGRR